MAERREFLRYAFYKVDRSFRALDPEERATRAKDAASVVESFAERLTVLTYSTVGTRADTDLLVWAASERLEDLMDLQRALNASGMGPFLAEPHSFLAMTRPSQYVDRHRHQGQEGRRKKLAPKGRAYLFVYPFTKTHAWYQLPFEERQRMMDAHIEVGHRFPSVSINTSYSFGLDDQEFVVAFETDRPADFLELVMALRSAEQRPYTERDTPIFTCVRMSPADAFASVV